MTFSGLRVSTCVVLAAGVALGFAGGAAAQTAADDIVLWSATVPPHQIRGDWVRMADASAAGGARLVSPDRGRPRVTPASAAPADYVELTFTAPRATAYHLWIRMSAERDSTANDSVHVQFSDSVTAAGQPTMRIGTTGSAEVVLQDGSKGAAPAGWGWTDNGWGTLGAPIYFASNGSHVLRIQRREDGAAIDQIVLSPRTFASAAPGAVRHDTRLLPRSAATAPVGSIGSSVVVRPAKASAARMFGRWQMLSDANAAGGQAVRNPDAGAAKIAPAYANPASYFEASFDAAAGRAYHVWIRMRADGNATANDSVHVQFNDAVTAAGAPVARIGTTGSLEFVLQAGAGAAAPRGWGWTDNGWGAAGAHVYFAGGGVHTIRVQQREDGAAVDQIVISPDVYLTAAPGWRRDDLTILPESAAPTPPGNLPPTVALTAPQAGASFTAPATITVAAAASDPENKLARVDFYAGTTRLGTDTTAPYSFLWTAVAAGSYAVTAVATDTSGLSATSAAVTVTVKAPASTAIRVGFTASADHAAVTSYLLEVFTATASPATATPIRTSDLGKPAPDASGEIIVDRTAFLNSLAAGSYQVTIAAVGPNGSARSTPIPFVR